MKVKRILTVPHKRTSPDIGSASWDQVGQLAGSIKGPDKEGQRAEFLELVREAKALYSPAT